MRILFGSSVPTVPRNLRDVENDYAEGNYARKSLKPIKGKNGSIVQVDNKKKLFTRRPRIPLHLHRILPLS